MNKTLVLTATMIAASMLATSGLAQVAPAIKSAGPHAITLVADGKTGIWKLNVGEGLDCGDVGATSGVLVPGEALALSLNCAIIGIIVEGGKTCWYVGAETETQDNAEASATMTCGNLSASCSSETDGGEYDYCYNDDSGHGNAPINCKLHADAAWWDAGSYARAACYVGYNQNT